MKEHVIINKDRTVNVPNSLQRLGVQYDHNVNTIVFDCPRYPDEDPTDDIGLLYRTGMFFGKGTSQATKNDYKLEDAIAFSDDGLSVVSSNIAHMPDENTLYTYVYAVKNNGVEPITISETGLISKTLTDQYKDNTTYTFLWARDTFEPVTLQPGETRPFTMTIGLE